jgi:hypothetical protein
MPIWEVEPTATHDDADKQVTEFSLLPTKPVPALGLDTIDHAVPFQDITNVVSKFMLPEYPTAMQFDAVVHDTDISLLLEPPPLGLDTVDHVDPSHTIANVVPANGEPEVPTATHEDADTHDTDSSSFEPLLGVVIVDHAVPFHAIANVVRTINEPAPPTATQFEALTHETDASLWENEASSGLDTTVAVSTTAPTDVEPANELSATRNMARTTRANLRVITNSF